MSAKTRNPLEPFASVVTFLAALLIAATVAGVVLAATTRHSSVWGIGAPWTCVQDDNISIDGSGAGPAFAHVVRPGVTASNHGLSLCAQHATIGQETLNVLTQLPSGLFMLGLLILLWRLATTARRSGPFAPVNTRYLRLIGWWLIVGDLIADNTQTVAQTALERSMLSPGQAPSWIDKMPGGSLPMLIAGLGILTIARILGMATAMRDELAATI